MQHVTLPIRELGCAAAAPAIEQALRDLPGIALVYVNPVTEMAYVQFDAEQCGEQELRTALERTGYGNEILATPHAPTSRWSISLAWLRSRVRRAFGSRTASSSSNHPSAEPS
jgi:copper chaperone CopZ